MLLGSVWLVSEINGQVVCHDAVINLRVSRAALLAAGACAMDGLAMTAGVKVM